MPDVPPASLRYLQLGLQELDRITQLLERLRALYRRPDFTWMDVDLNTMVQDTCRVMHHQLQRRRILLTQQLDPALPGVRGQPDALRQVLLTLLLNQQTVTADGGTIEIATLADYADEPYVIVQIDSAGIASIQAWPALNLDAGEPGTGVYLSRLVIEQHGGRLQTRFSPDGHATTTICLPFQR
jgi:nitrogen-specific signal transduction histidine kinase